MKWDQLQTLQPMELKLVRHDYGRKIGEWSEANARVIVSRDLADRLGILDVAKDSSPFDELPEPFTNSIFIARLPNKRMYLVNTEGHSYSRYVAKCSIVE